MNAMAINKSMRRHDASLAIEKVEVEDNQKPFVLMIDGNGTGSEAPCGSSLAPSSSGSEICCSTLFITRKQLLDHKLLVHGKSDSAAAASAKDHPTKKTDPNSCDRSENVQCTSCGMVLSCFSLDSKELLLEHIKGHFPSLAVSMRQFHSNSKHRSVPLSKIISVQRDGNAIFDYLDKCIKSLFRDNAQKVWSVIDSVWIKKPKPSRFAETQAVTSANTIAASHTGSRLTEAKIIDTVKSEGNTTIDVDQSQLAVASPVTAVSTSSSQQYENKNVLNNVPLEYRCIRCETVADKLSQHLVCDSNESVVTEDKLSQHIVFHLNEDTNMHRAIGQQLAIIIQNQNRQKVIKSIRCRFCSEVLPFDNSNSLRAAMLHALSSHEGVAFSDLFPYPKGVEPLLFSCLHCIVRHLFTATNANAITEMIANASPINSLKVSSSLKRTNLSLCDIEPAKKKIAVESESDDIRRDSGPVHALDIMMRREKVPAPFHFTSVAKPVKTEFTSVLITEHRSEMEIHYDDLKPGTFL